jgi:hypothetical protein
LKDKLTIGFIEGIIGGVIMNLFDLILVGFHWADVRYIDYAAVFIFGNKPVFWFDTVLALLVHVIFTGLLGIVFAYLMDYISSKYYLLKGGYYGAVAWFTFYVIAFLHKVPLFIKTSWPTAVSDLVSSIVYGLVLAETLRRLMQKYLGTKEWKGTLVMEDRFVRGLIAGIIAGIVQVGVDFALEVFRMGTIRYLDYAAVIIYGNKPVFWFDTLFAQLAYIGFAGFAGIIFAYFITWVSSKNYLLKGWLFAIGLWFSIYAVGMMYKVQLMHKVPWPDAVSNFISTSIFGLVAAVLLQRLTPKEN